MPESKGVLITEVEAASAGARAGLKAGDCIIEFDGQKVPTPADLARLINRLGSAEAATEQKNEISVKIVRDRQEQRVKVETVSR